MDIIVLRNQMLIIKGKEEVRCLLTSITFYQLYSWSCTTYYSHTNLNLLAVHQ
jgi:hypothetical protein